MIGLRLFKTSGMFVGANRQAGCKYLSGFYGHVRTIVCRVSNFNLATSRSCFEDYTYILGAEELLLCDFGPDKAVDKSLIFIDCLSMS